MADFQLNPVTRKRMIYILAFLLLDTAVALYVAFSDPYGGASLPAFGFAVISLAAAGTIASILIVEKYDLSKLNIGGERKRV